MLRVHLGHLAKAGMVGVAPSDRRLRGWDGWSDDSIEMHLTTRFKQLEITTRLELWSEGFRTVEDIHAIMHISPKAPKSKVMANYYDKLIKIFWVSENYLFHAYAWLKFYALSDSFNTRMTSEERQSMADSVVLAALSIPDNSIDANLIEDKANIDSVASANLLKNQHMASLLGFHSNPNRKALLVDLNNRKLLDLVSPHVKSLYESLETTFQPLDLVSKVTPLLASIDQSESAGTKEMVKPLTRLVVLRLLKQLSSVYYTVKVDHFLKLVKDLGYSHDDVSGSLFSCSCSCLFLFSLLRERETAWRQREREMFKSSMMNINISCAGGLSILKLQVFILSDKRNDLFFFSHCANETQYEV
jgi:translation initiation factor 3 subunit A